MKFEIVPCNCSAFCLVRFNFYVLSCFYFSSAPTVFNVHVCGEKLLSLFSCLFTITSYQLYCPSGSSIDLGGAYRAHGVQCEYIRGIFRKDN
eukprot:TsM_000372000 transcript=TsM_000372000 gene=TsM_000372000